MKFDLFIWLVSGGVSICLPRLSGRCNRIRPELGVLRPFPINNGDDSI